MFCAVWFIFGFWNIASKMEWLEGRVLSRVLSKMRWLWGSYLRKNQYKNRLNLKKADLLCLNRIETDEHLYYNHDFKLVLVQLSLCWGKTILYVHIPWLPSHHLKLTRSKLYHWAHIWLLLPTYTTQWELIQCLCLFLSHATFRRRHFLIRNAELNFMSKFNNCLLFHSEREFLDLQRQSSSMSNKPWEIKLWRKLRH